MPNENDQRLNKKDEFMCSSFISREKRKKNIVSMVRIFCKNNIGNRFPLMFLWQKMRYQKRVKMVCL